MSYFSYGGPPGSTASPPVEGITLEDATVLAYQRAPQMNGPDYVSTKHIVRVRGVYNPLSTSYVQANALSSPIRRAGFMAPATDTAIRHALMQPARQLYLAVGNSTLLRSPRPGRTLDTNNGPFCLGCDVSAILGTKTFVVDCAYETTVNECHLYTAAPAVLLSHRWQMRHSIDQDFYTTRTIQGRAIFDADRLASLQAEPDDFRGYLFHPVPRGMQRALIEVSEDQSGNELMYTCIDRERSHNIIGLARQVGVTRITCTHSVGTGLASALSLGKVGRLAVLGTGGEGAAGLAAGIPGGGGVAIGAKWGPAPAGGAVMPGGGMTTPAEAIAAAAATAFLILGRIPTTTETCTCRVWGHKRSRRDDLESVAATVIRRRIDTAAVDVARDAINASWVHDVVGKFVECSVAIETPVPNQVMSGSFSRLFANRPGAALGGDENIPDVLSIGDGQNPLPPAAGFGGSVTADIGTRGTYVESLAAAALLGSCVTPARPPLTTRAQGLVP